MSWFPANFNFPATPKNMNQNSPLLTSQQNWNTSVINARVSPIFVKQEELISRAGSFLWFWTSWSEICWEMESLEIKKSSWKFFDGNSRKFIESTHLCWNCLESLWSSCLWGSSRQFAMKFGPEMGKKNDLLSFTIFLLFAFSVYRNSFKKFWNFQWISGDDFNNSVTHLDW